MKKPLINRINGQDKNIFKREKTVKIIIVNYRSRLNKGYEALLKSRVNALKKIISNLEFTVFARDIGFDRNFDNVKFLKAEPLSLSKKNLFTKKTATIVYLLFRCVLWRVINQCCHADIKSLRDEKTLNEYYDADVVLSIGGDSLTEDYGKLLFLPYVINFLFPILLKKPIVLSGESIGPFKWWVNKVLARFLFNRMRLITLREENSRASLRKLKIERVPIYVTADSAFLLEPISTQRSLEILQKEGLRVKRFPLVGISASKITSYYKRDNDSFEQRYQKYIKLIARITDYIIDSLDAVVIFIPHSTETWKKNDDRTVAADVYKLMDKNREKIILIKGDYPVEESKGIIGQCDLFISTRLHATIASTSMCVPTIAIGYSSKTEGIIGKMLGYKEYALDIDHLSYASLTSTIENAWNNRLKIEEDLCSKINNIKKRASIDAELIKEIIQK